MPDRDVAIIGAGPYGLAVAARLKPHGLDMQVFGEEMSYWRNMPRGMLLRSPYQASSFSDSRGPVGIPRYEEEIGRKLDRPIPLDEFVRYGEWVQQRVAPDIDRRRVEQVARENGHFKISLADGDSLTVRRVVIATGLESFERPVPEFRHLPRSLASHTASLHDPAAFAGQRVIVIGHGQSAIESTALLHEAGADVEVVMRAQRVRWLTRTAFIHKKSGRLRPLFYPDTDVGPPGLNQVAARPGLCHALPAKLMDPLAARCIRPAASAWLVDRTADVRFTAGRRVTKATESAGRVEVDLDDGSSRTVDHVILGTGFRLDVRTHPLLASELAESVAHRDGLPRLGAGYESSVPGLHFAGAITAGSFGPVMRFVCGSWYTSAAIERAIARDGGRRREVSSVARTEPEAIADAS